MGCLYRAWTISWIVGKAVDGVPKNRLKGFSGIMQTDGYSGYNHFRDTQGIVSLGCWDHARRKFVDAIKLVNNNKNGLAGKFVKLIAKLYNIEREHKQSKNDTSLMLHA